MSDRTNRANAPTPDEHVCNWTDVGVPYSRGGRTYIRQQCNGCGNTREADITPNTAKPS